MPFVSEAQRKKCFAIMRNMNQVGMVSNWDCHEFSKGTSPKRSPRIKRRDRKTPKKMGKMGGEQVFKGVRGGEFVIRNNKKVYF
jgi:hypothetical protein